MVGNRDTDRAGARGGREAHPGRQPERRGTPGTVALTDHATGAPVGMPDRGDDGGELAAMHDLPKRSDIRGKVITPGALHTVRDTARPIAERKGAACVFTGRANAPETHDTPGRIDRERDGHCDGDVDRAHGRTGQRRTGVLTPGPGTVTWPGIRQVARVRRWRESVLPGDAGKPGTGTVYLITSLGAEAASPRELLALNRGHWAVESPTHRVRDTVPDGDACQTRTGNGPTNRAGTDMIALAVVFADRRGGEGITEAMRRLQPTRGDAIRAVRDPPPAPAEQPPPPPLFSIENTSRRRRGATRCDGPGHPG